MKKITVLIIALLLIGCKEEKRKKNFFMGEFRTISFEKEYKLLGEQLYVDALGTVIVDVFGPYLIVRNHKVPGINFFTKFYSIEDNKYIGEYFRMGNGPLEFRSFNITKTEYPFLWTYDFYEKHVLKFNLEKGMDEKSQVVERKYDYQSLANSFNIYKISVSIRDVLKLLCNFIANSLRTSYVLVNPDFFSLLYYIRIP